MVEDVKKKLVYIQFSPGAKNFSACLSMHLILLLILTEYLYTRQHSGPRLVSLLLVGLMLVLVGFGLLTGCSRCGGG